MRKLLFIISIFASLYADSQVVNRFRDSTVYLSPRANVEIQNQFKVVKGANTTLIADTNGNVGIGTAVPTYKLDVVGGVLMRTTSNAYPMKITVDGTGDYGLYSVSATDSTRTGKVAIIQLVPTNIGDPFYDKTATIQYANGMYSNVVKVDSIGVSIIGGYDASPPYDTLLFASSITKFVGIGTATPTAKLHVNGTTYIEGELKLKYAGHDTLTAGIDTVYTSAVSDTSLIFVTAQHENGTTHTGNMTVTAISSGNYFVVQSLKSNATTETGDTRHYNWMVIRKE